MTTLPSVFVPRRATAREAQSRSITQPLANWSQARAYVLLAAPGAGKTEAMKAEAAATGSPFVSASHMISPGWQAPTLAPGQALYIDGLDEARAGTVERNRPLHVISKVLKEMGFPPIRLSCREADWIEALDRGIVSQLTEDQMDVTELRLEPLNEDEIRTILAGTLGQATAADHLWHHAERQGLLPVMGNPLFLRLLITSADAQGRLPATRSDTFQLACEKLASEHNSTHRAHQRHQTPSTTELLNQAGMLCSVQLLSGAQALSFNGQTENGDVAIDTLPLEMPAEHRRQVLESKLFKVDGDRCQPVHRSIAEYLAARELARRMREQALPVARVLSLMCGDDGGVVQPLRGLHAWLAVHSFEHRSTLIERDPLGIVLYGDVQRFTVREKTQILQALEQEARQFAWFRNGAWADHPFGALGTADMQDTYEALLNNPTRSDAHQALLDCVLDAIRHGQPLPALLPTLSRVVRDRSHAIHTRTNAAQAWLAQARHAGQGMQVAQGWLTDVRQGILDDPQDELLGVLLDELYPQHAQPSEVMQHFHVPKAESFHGSYLRFWRTQLIERTPAASRPLLADALPSLPIDRDSLHNTFDLSRILGRIITAALHSLSGPVDSTRVHCWLKSGLDVHGFCALKGEAGKGIRTWLSEHPNVQKDLMSLAWRDATPPWFWEAGELLYGAKQPRDWHRWLLEYAAQTSLEPLAKRCFEEAAHQALNPSTDFDITLEDVEQWCANQQARWPAAHSWREAMWSCPIDAPQAEIWHRQQRWQAAQLVQQIKRRERVAPYVEAMRDGTAPAGLFHQLALSYFGRYTDVDGETPEERLGSFLGDAAWVPKALQGFKQVLNRPDLPDVPDILKTGLASQMHYLNPASLIGAELVTRDDPSASDAWPVQLLQRLVAFWLTDGTEHEPGWYRHLVQTRAALVAPIFINYAQGMLRKQAERPITGLWAFNTDEGAPQLAKIVLPKLLEGFPARANQAQLRVLNQELLPAAIRHLEQTDLIHIQRARLTLKSLDAPQRIAWLVAGLGIEPDRMANELIQFVGTSQARAHQMADTLSNIGTRLASRMHLPVHVWTRLIERLAPHAEPNRPDKAFWFGAVDERREWVHGMITRLAESAEPGAADALRSLRAQPNLARWRTALDVALAAHIRSARESSFKHAMAADVVRTLCAKEPANATDLGALTVEHLRQLGTELQHADMNGVAMFWRPQRVGKGKNLDQKIPEIENTCRDRLMPVLRERLSRVSVQLEKEASAQQDTRADLRVSAVIHQQRVVVPIEVKKEDHDQVWLAWRDQLDGSYATDPAARGHGIYLVLWFGHNPRSNPEGEKPTNAAHLERLLRERIPQEDRHRLQVVVLDLSL